MLCDPVMTQSQRTCDRRGVTVVETGMLTMILEVVIAEIAGTDIEREAEIVWMRVEITTEETDPEAEEGLEV